MREKDEAKKFKMDVAKFSGNYREFVIIAKTGDGRLFWKATDKTWALGAIQRYSTCVDEMDRMDEQQQIFEFGGDE